MPNVKGIQQVIAPKIKTVGEKAAKKMEQVVAQPKAAKASAADAMASQGQAMVNMQKKAYVAPKTSVHEVKSRKVICQSGQGVDGPNTDPFGVSRYCGDEW